MPRHWGALVEPLSCAVHGLDMVDLKVAESLLIYGAGTMEIRVDVVERLGSGQFLYGQVGGDSITARVDPRINVAPGDRIRLGLDSRGLHLFDHETEQALF